MAAGSRPRPCVELEIHDDHSHKASSPPGTATSALGELPLSSVQNIRLTSTSIDSLARQLGNFHIHSTDKENKPRPAGGASTAQAKSISSDAKHTPCEHSRGGTSGIPPDSEGDLLSNNPLASASQRLPSTREQLWKHQEATRVRGEEDFVAGVAAVMDMGSGTMRQVPQSDLAMPERRDRGDDVAKNPELVIEVRDLGPSDRSASDDSSPLSRIEDSVEALDKLEEDIEALAEVARLNRALYPEAGKGASQSVNGAGTRTTPLKRAASVGPGTNSARGKTVERSSSVRKSNSTPAKEDEKPAVPSTRKVPRPASLLPPKPPAKSSKPTTVPAFELPGEAVARRLKEQREQRQSQQITPEQAAALAAAYSPSKPHFKSPKPPTRPAFELPGEAISRKKREEREAKLRAQEEEERKRREFKARPIRASFVPSSIPRETLASLARQKSHQQPDGSSDSATITVTPASEKRRSIAAFFSTSAPRTTPSTTPAAAATLPSRGRSLDDNSDNKHTTDSAAAPSSRGTSTSTGSGSGKLRSTVSAEEAAQQKLRGKEVFTRENSYTATRERERREREEAARRARQEAAERSRMLSREWAERQRVKKEREVRV